MGILKKAVVKSAVMAGKAIKKGGSIVVKYINNDPTILQGTKKKKDKQPKLEQKLPSDNNALENTTTCIFCGEIIVSGAKFCSSCGKEQVVKKKFCCNCGHELSVNAKFCTNCGTRVD